MTARNAFGKQLKKLRTRGKGVTQYKIAHVVGLSPSTVSRLESGDRFPSREVAQRIADLIEPDGDTLMIAGGYVPDYLVLRLINDTTTPENVANVLAASFKVFDVVQELRNLIRNYDYRIEFEDDASMKLILTRERALIFNLMRYIKTRVAEDGEK